MFNTYYTGECEFCKSELNVWTEYEACGSTVAAVEYAECSSEKCPGEFVYCDVCDAPVAFEEGKPVPCGVCREVA